MIFRAPCQSSAQPAPSSILDSWACSGNSQKPLIRSKKVGNSTTGSAQTKWTEKELAELVLLYPDTSNEELGVLFKRTAKAIQCFAQKRGLHKSAEFKSSVQSSNRAKQGAIKRSGRPPNRPIPEANKRITVERVPGGRIITHLLGW